MKFATWNVNSLTVRLPQVLDWLSANPVDVLVLQELKMTDDKFPFDAFTQAGYHAERFGQKTFRRTFSVFYQTQKIRCVIPYLCCIIEYRTRRL